MSEESEGNNNRDIVEVLKEKKKYEEVAGSGTHTHTKDWIFDQDLRWTEAKVKLREIENRIEQLKEEIFNLEGKKKKAEKQKDTKEEDIKALEENLEEYYSRLRILNSARRRQKRWIKEIDDVRFYMLRDKIADALVGIVKEEDALERKKVEKEGVEVV